MSIDTMMLLTSSTALQGWFETWGTEKKKWGEDYLAEGELICFSGRLVSVIPYFSSPALLQVFSTMVSNPFYIGGGLLLANLIPSAVYLLSDDKDSDVAKTAETVSKIMGVVMKVLNLVMIGMLFSTASAPLSAAAVVGLTASAVFTVMSLYFTFVNQAPKPEFE